MSWASYRQTTRIEDRAYCLLGLFDINMPLLYGEGKNAFQRLQREILSISDDETIFAWGFGLPLDFRKLQLSLLASGPEQFAGCRDVIPVVDKLLERPHYSMTNKGLKIEAKYLKIPTRAGWLMLLNCTVKSSSRSSVSAGSMGLIAIAFSPSADLLPQSENLGFGLTKKIIRCPWTSPTMADPDLTSWSTQEVYIQNVVYRYTTSPLFPDNWVDNFGRQLPCFAVATTQDLETSPRRYFFRARSRFLIVDMKDFLPLPVHETSISWKLLVGGDYFQGDFLLNLKAELGEYDGTVTSNVVEINSTVVWDDEKCSLSIRN